MWEKSTFSGDLDDQPPTVSFAKAKYVQTAARAISTAKGRRKTNMTTLGKIATASNVEGYISTYTPPRARTPTPPKAPPLTLSVNCQPCLKTSLSSTLKCSAG